MKKEYDIIIIGSGCSGYAAAMYSGRFQLKTLVLGSILGGTIISTNIVENYPGFIKISGQEIIDKLKSHALDYKEFVEIKQEKVVDIKKMKNCFRIKTDKSDYISRAIIIATGTKHRKLGIAGEDKFSGRGVHTCMLCDGFAYRNKIVAVVGGSDSAAKEVILGAQLAKKVYMIYRGDKIRPEPINMKRINNLIKAGKIEIINNANISEIIGDKFVTHVILDKPYKGSKKFKLDGLFVEIGADPMSELAKKLKVKLNKKGEIIIDRESKTNIRGVFAAGDVVDTRFKQAITGVGEAVSASYSAYKYISENEVYTC